MKIILNIIIFLTLTSVAAQNQYEKGMTKAFELWEAKKNDEAINLFERIGKAEKENWLPYYYAAQIHIITSFNIKDVIEIESRLKKAQNYLNEAKIFSKDNAEILIMQAMLHTAYVVYDGAKYGMSLAPKIEALYVEAKKLEPENPRAILYHAEWKMGAAKFWGTDPKVFCSEVEKAILYFEKQLASTLFYPDWGKDQISRIQENCN